ncbi:MAG: FYVE zinc finger domain-containing protein [Pirellulales bacterium]
MHYDRFLDIFLCTSRTPDAKHKDAWRRQTRDGYYLDHVSPTSYIQARQKLTKIGVVNSKYYDQQEVSNIPKNDLEQLLKGSVKYIACNLDVNYVNGSTGPSAAKSIPQLKLLMDWICERSIVSKLLICGHGGGVADGTISCAGYRATAGQLATSLVLNGLRKGDLQRQTPTAKPGASWKPDQGNDTCYCCKKAIKKGVFVSNKHHCRRCGEIIHDECSKTRIVLEKALTEKHGLQQNAGRVRVCDICADELNSSWVAANPRQHLNICAGLRQITLMTCRGARSTDQKGSGIESGNNSFAIQSFASNFVKDLRAKNIRGVRVAAANETVSFGRDGQKNATTIKVPKLNQPPTWDVSKDGIPNKIYGWDRSFAEQIVNKSRNAVQLQPGQAQGPIDIRQFDNRVFLIKVSPDRSSLFFGFFQDDIEGIVTNFFTTQWGFPQWRVQKVQVTSGVLGTIQVPNNNTAFAQFSQTQNTARNRMSGNFAGIQPKSRISHSHLVRAQNRQIQMQGTTITLQLTPPPGYNMRFEELIDAIKLTAGQVRVSWKDVKVIETS